MKETILRLQQEMEQAIDRISRYPSDTNQTEQCYQVVAHFWQLAKQEVRQSGFHDDAVEIDFFKHLKPGFTARLEFYLLLFRYYLYTDGGSEVIEQYRKDELDRIRQFREAHTPFIHYFEKGRTEWDDVYFLRRKFNKVQHPPSQVYDRAADLWTNGDWILALLHANARFERFLQNQHHSDLNWH